MKSALIEPFSVPEIFVDGFDGYVARTQYLSCAGYRFQQCEEGGIIRVINHRIVMPIANLGEVIQNALIAAKDFPVQIDLEAFMRVGNACH